MPPVEPAVKRRPNRILLAAIQTAIEVGVDQTRLAAAVGIALQAKSVEQAPVYRMIARLLNRESEKIKPGSTADQFGNDADDDDDDTSEDV